MKKIKKWEGLIKKFSYIFQNSIADAEDARQEAICEVLLSVKNNKKPIKDINKYIASIIRNAIIKQSIRTQLVLKVPLPEMSRYSQQEIKQLTNSLENDIIDNRRSSTWKVELLDALDYHDVSRIGRMYFLEGYNIREISKKIGISVGKVMTKIQEIKEKMKREFEEV